MQGAVRPFEPIGIGALMSNRALLNVMQGAKYFGPRICIAGVGEVEDL